MATASPCPATEFRPLGEKKVSAHLPAALSLFEDTRRTSSNEDGKDAMPEEFTLTGWSKLGGLVRDTRLSKALSQAVLATQANVARSWLVRVEAGHRVAELEPLLRLLAALDLTLTLQSSVDAQQRTRPSTCGTVRWHSPRAFPFSEAPIQRKGPNRTCSACSREEDARAACLTSSESPWTMPSGSSRCIDCPGPSSSVGRGSEELDPKANTADQ